VNTDSVPSGLQVGTTAVVDADRRNTMTTLTTRARRHRNGTLSLLGAALVAVLLVSGCSSPAPEAPMAASDTPSVTAIPTPPPTPTPTSTAEVGAIEEPTSEDEAIEGATAAATAYYAIRTEIEVEHPADSSAIDTIAIEAAAEKVHASARKLVESGRTYTGAFSYTAAADSYAAPSTGADGTVYPFGSAHLVGCVDSASIIATNSDGSPVEMNPNRRGILELTVVYHPTGNAWLVQDVRAPEEVVPC
jgi:hypothetical protein